MCPLAGLEEYAAPIIDVLDPTGELITARIYRDGTTKTEHYQCVKDMQLVGRDLDRTVLVDDTPLAFLHQPNNGIPVLGFRGDPDDRLLHEAVLPLLQVGDSEQGDSGCLTAVVTSSSLVQCHWCTRVTCYRHMPF